MTRLGNISAQQAPREIGSVNTWPTQLYHKLEIIRCVQCFKTKICVRQFEEELKEKKTEKLRNCVPRGE